MAPASAEGCRRAGRDQQPKRRRQAQTVESYAASSQLGMRAVAEGLFLAQAAGAPPVAFAFLYFSEWGLLSDNWFRHGSFPSIAA